MRSSSFVGALVGASALIASTAHAQQQAKGYDLERLYTSAPGAGWFVMDALDMHGGFGGALSLVTSYAHDPLRVTDGQQRLAVVSDEAFVQLGLAATYDRFRLYVTFDSPLTVQGNSGAVGGWTYTAPSVDLGSSPDAITHGRLGADARVLGRADGPLRLGLSAQLWFPGGAPGSLRDNYLSDGSPGDGFGAYSFMGRALFAGDRSVFTYAAHAGIHVRGLDDQEAPVGPRGHELVFGGAAGVRTPILGAMLLVVGPEIFGQTAVRSAFAQSTTGLEGLFTGRLEGSGEAGPQLRVKVGTGVGLDARFGAPEWRLVFGIEMFSRGGAPRSTGGRPL